MTQLGDIIDTRVVFYIEFSRKGDDDWYRGAGDADAIDVATRIMDRRNASADGFEYRIVRETTITEVVKS